ncbi:hypothetical protein ACWGI8_05950 [Streptomyces sp. NPDC054841]
MERTGTTRRRALMATGAAAAAALTGCSSDEPPVRRTSPAPVSAETVLRRRSAAASSALLGRYDEVLITHPELASRLAPLRAAVARHVEALSPTGVRPSASASAAASGRATPGASPTARPGATPVATDADTAVRELASAERSTADAHTAALADAPPEFARLLASVAAAGAAHAYLLTKGARA